MSARGDLALEALVSLRRAVVAIGACKAADYRALLDDMRAAGIAAHAIADAEIAERERPASAARTAVVICAEIAELEAKIANAAQWGAAVGAWGERISELRAELRRALRDAAAKDDGA